MNREELKTLGFIEPVPSKSLFTYWKWWYESPKYDNVLLINTDADQKMWLAKIRFELRRGLQPLTCVIAMPIAQITERSIKILKELTSLDSRDPKVEALLVALKSEEDDEIFFYSAEDAEKRILSNLVTQQGTHEVVDEGVASRIRAFVLETQ